MFLIWDVLFGIVLYGELICFIGVGDLIVDVDNEYGLVGLYWVVFKCFWGVVCMLEGWKLGEVLFGLGYWLVLV